jgi:Arc/MetJ family transcription regulator
LRGRKFLHVFCSYYFLHNALVYEQKYVYVYNSNTHKRGNMRTNIVIDDDLMKNAKNISGLRTKKETIESALKLLIQVKSQSFIKKYRGKMKWEGDLESMRRD